MMSINDFSYKQIVFLTTVDGEKLSFKNDNIVITDKYGKTIHQSTCYRLFAVFVVGHITITSGLIERAKKFGFSIVLLSTTFRMIGTICNSAEGNVLLRKKQYSYNELQAGKFIVENKIRNQISTLKKNRKKSEFTKETIQKLESYFRSVNNADGIQSIMGVEGSASRLYFVAHFDNIQWNSRKPRTKIDMVNTLMDIGYTILFSYIDAIVGLFGFDKYVGVLHRQFYMRKSLICDLVEPFRCLIDNQIKQSINLYQFKEEDFEIYNKKWCLKYCKSSQYASIFLKEINEHKIEIYTYVRDFYRAIMKGITKENFPVWNYE
ncbi:MAG: type V CRISPR-associated endonuclease Cas1 [Clostridia bacterium]|nr:type V CRISPR-associated endonuclease Cas1 [Clostridia bacterium]